MSLQGRGPAGRPTVTGRPRGHPAPAGAAQSRSEPRAVPGKGTGHPGHRKPLRRAPRACNGRPGATAHGTQAGTGRTASGRQPVKGNNMNPEPQRVFARGHNLPTYTNWLRFVEDRKRMRVRANGNEVYSICPSCSCEVSQITAHPMKIRTTIQTASLDHTEIMKESDDSFIEVEFMKWDRKPVMATVPGCVSCSLHAGSKGFVNIEASRILSLTRPSNQ